MRHFGLIGKSISHSFSPDYFSKKFEELRLECRYTAFDIPSISSLKDHVEIDQLEGFNVTIPFKEEIIPFLDSIDPTAQEIGAVNCVRVRNGKKEGFNTDAHGFIESLKPLLKPESPPKALVLGSGGASKAVVYGLKELNIESTVVSRQAELNYDNLTASHVRENTYIINTTPLGMAPNVDGYPDIPYEAIHAGHVCFDLIYNPAETLFLKKSRILGATTKNGHEMLVLQAEKSWDIWNEA